MGVCEKMEDAGVSVGSLRLCDLRSTGLVYKGQSVMSV